MIDRALYLDQRSVEEAAEALLAISSLLEAFKQKNPGIFNQLSSSLPRYITLPLKWKPESNW